MYECGLTLVVIPVYNAEGYLDRCLDSVFAQTRPNLQVIVVDDGSTDRTPEIVGSWEGVEFVAPGGNRGPAAARTEGLRRCRGEFVAFLDADDYWLPGFLEATASYLEHDPDAVAVFTAFISRRWDGTEVHGPDLDADERARFDEGGARLDCFYRFWARRMSVLTGTVLMRTEAALRTGGQRSDLRLMEDWEFWGYLATFGPWGFVPRHLFVTDEQAITPRERLHKTRRRAELLRDVSVAGWAERILPRLDAEAREALEGVLSHVATGIAIAKVYSGRWGEARTVAEAWQGRLRPGLGSILGAGLRFSPWCWPAFCFALAVREHVKAYAPGVLQLGMRAFRLARAPFVEVGAETRPERCRSGR